MKRIPLLAIASALAFLGAASADDRPEIVLTLSCGPRSVELGEAIPLRVTLEKKTGRPLEVNALRLDRTSISFQVEVGGKSHTVTRIHGEIRDAPGGTGKSVTDGPAPRTMLVRGSPLSLEVPMLAIRAGRVRLTALYEGLPDDRPTLRSDPVEVEVPGPGEKSRIGAVMQTTEGTLILDLWPDRAYNTVLHFLTLAKEGFYDGLTFHRILPGYLVQGGDPKGDGTGGPGFTIPDEVDPGVPHEKGVISLAKAPGIPDTGGCQFFLMLAEDPRLDPEYTAFGRVAQGMDTLHRLAAVARTPSAKGESSTPVEPPVIRSLRVVAR